MGDKRLCVGSTLNLTAEIQIISYAFEVYGTGFQKRQRNLVGLLLQDPLTLLKTSLINLKNNKECKVPWWSIRLMLLNPLGAFGNSPYSY